VLRCFQRDIFALIDYQLADKHFISRCKVRLFAWRLTFVKTLWSFWNPGICF
jgi:hypothetical protein